MSESDPADVSSNALSPAMLRPKTDPEQLGFSTTSELEPTSGLIGQDRALHAIELGASIDQADFNLFVLGPSAAGKSTAVRTYLENKAGKEPDPRSWVYVNNFDRPNKPIAIALVTGQCEQFADGMVAVVDELLTAVPAMFESDEYQSLQRAINEEFRDRQEQAFETLNQKAQAQNIAVLRAPTGIAIAPMRDGKVIKQEEFQDLDESVRKDIETQIEALQKELAAIAEQVPGWQKELHSKLQTLNEERASMAISSAFTDIRAAFADHIEIIRYLDAAALDLVQNVGIFLTDQQDENPQIVARSIDTTRDDRFRQYMVNVLVSPVSGNGAPIVEELNPGQGNLVGRVEHIARMGALITDFLLIKPGALHRANGGYLMIDARRLLLMPNAWESLKRALKRQEIVIELPGEGMSVVSTQSLDPAPIPLKVKVILFGDRQLYYALSAMDPDFARIFKIQADFDETIDRTSENITDYARLIASIVRSHDLKPVSAEGVVELLGYSSRLSGDGQKLSLEIGKLADVVREADYWAGKSDQQIISAAHISRTISEQIHRADRLKQKSHESITRNVMLVDTSGTRVGQINGLSVLSLGNFSFGKPTRISARVRVGEGRVTDIEREVELGGPLHSKGVMILWGYLAGRYADDVPLSLAASLVFEQSYGGVDGDSASSTELYALLSALSGVPIRQSLAVTGSVNQFGDVQAIGGANEKIEGFFDICTSRGLTGEQGVLIPQANVQHLNLREDVVAAVRDKQFTIYSVDTIDTGIELLTGTVAGVKRSDGSWTQNSINALVDTKLRELAGIRKSFSFGGAGRLLSS